MSDSFTPVSLGTHKTISDGADSFALSGGNSPPALGVPERRFRPKSLGRKLLRMLGVSRRAVRVDDRGCDGGPHGVRVLLEERLALFRANGMRKIEPHPRAAADRDPD